MLNGLMKNFLKIILIFFISSSSVNAACDFLINIGDKGSKIFEKFAAPLPGFKGMFYLPVQSPGIEQVNKTSP